MTGHADTAAIKAATLTEALPYLQRYAGRTFVIKYGGHAMGDPAAALDLPATSSCCGRSGSTRSSSMAAGRRSARCSKSWG